MISTRNDPWEGLAEPAPGAVTAKRVEGDRPWDSWWMRDASSLMLFIESRSIPEDVVRLPRFRSLTAELLQPAQGRSGLILRLIDTSRRDLFHVLAMDVLTVVDTSESEHDAIRDAIAQTWRWHHLLRSGGVTKLLSDEEQRGLLGELVCLRDLVAAAVGWTQAVQSWQGPYDAPKDFEVGLSFLESKTRRGGAQPFVSISSEFQLEIPQGSRLFLAVTGVDRVGNDAAGATTITDLCRTVRRSVVELAPESLAEFEACLAALGFRWGDDYSDDLWIIGQTSLFEVAEQFPAIAGGDLHSGISRVTYDVALNALDTFRCDDSTFMATLGG